MSRARLAALLLSALAVASCLPGRLKETPHAADAGPADPAVIARGEYLVVGVAGCGDCHTPRDASGKPDMSRWLAGVDDRFDVVPDDATRGAISTPNLTPDPTGLADWGDDEIKRAILDGTTDLGKPLYPLMPYYVFHNMTGADADAIVAYLRTIPKVAHAAPPRQPLPLPLTAPASPIPDVAIPHTTLKSNDPNFARAERGRYLATSVALCMDCHSAWRAGSSDPLDTTALFAGGRPFSAREWGVTAPDGGAAPSIVYAYNITPHPSGLAGWKPPQVAKLLKKGLDDVGQSICRPMPSGPTGTFGSLSDQDALDIGLYVTTLPPIESGDIPQCPR